MKENDIIFCCNYYPIGSVYVECAKVEIYNDGGGKFSISCKDDEDGIIRSFDVKNITHADVVKMPDNWRKYHPK